MASSDDDSETVPENVSDYQFLSGSNTPISFTVLPLDWNEGKIGDGKPKQVFLNGQTDNGLRKIYMQVTAWKFDLSCKKPEIFVSAEGHWIKLLKPWRPFHDIIRKIEVTLHLLHFLKWNPQRSEKALWDHLNKTLSMFERRPCPDDLADHLPLIKEAVNGDKELADSKILSTLLEEKPWERKNSNEGARPSFIIDDVNGEEDQDDGGTDEDGDDGSDEDDCYDHMCAFCDNGGEVLICDGKCMRSFHATIEDGEESNCDSLGLTDEEQKAIQNVPFICGNCKYREHQCFACGELGSSDESSPEVFCCVNGTCGKFFHPDCVAKLLHPGDSAAAAVLKLKIAAGEQFACPAHTCQVCKEVEVRSVKELQFAVCRRCPRAYHRKCLPREITCEEDADEETGILQRAWEKLIPHRILIYCLDHEIDPEFLTPGRDHIKFPGCWRESKKKLPLESQKKRHVALEDNAGKRVSAIPPKLIEEVSSNSAPRDVSRKQVEKFPLHSSSKKQKVVTNRNSFGKLKESTIDAGETLGDKLYATFFGMDSEPLVSSHVGIVDGENEISQKVKPTSSRINYSLPLDADLRKRMLDLMEEAESSVTQCQIKERHTSLSTNVQSKLSFTITFGQAEASVQALRAALRKLNEGGSVQDAKAVCGVDLLAVVLRWKEKLRVYLSPFLHGMRYTSFGRHFTKIDKLEEIVDILHWYVQDGDMLVDFSCGSNDFSCSMKKKLDEMGKGCSFKNYDIVQAQIDFNFERRDWMEVSPDELPDGSKLIMGLNPPFGVRASLANKFINKALEFKPKLLILIVPPETQRLDEKESPYDLIWEDDNMLAGKSFYLPGSVDTSGKQIEDWNITTSLLYLWSHPNWTPRHRAIAEQHGHRSGAPRNCRSDESPNDMNVPNPPQECDDLDKSLVKQCEDLHENLEQDKLTTAASHQQIFPSDDNGRGGGTHHIPAKNHLELKSKRSVRLLEDKLDFGDKEEREKKRRSPEDKSEIGDKGEKKRQCPEDNSAFGGNGKKNVGSLEDKLDFGDKGEKKRQSPEDNLAVVGKEKKNVGSLEDKLDYGDKGEKKRRSPEDKSEFGYKGEKRRESPEDNPVFGGTGKNNARSLEDKSDFGEKGEKKRRSSEGMPNFGRKGKKNRQSLEGKSSVKPSLSCHFSPRVADHKETSSPKHEPRVRVHYGSFQQLKERTFSSYQPYFQTGYNGDERIDDVVRRYSLNGDESHQGMISRQACAPSHAPGYHSRASTDQWVPLDGRANSFAEPNHWGQRAACPPGFPFPPYGETGTSAMPRYGPRLDDMNHVRMTNIVCGPPEEDMDSIHHPRGPPRPPFQGSLGFAPGPYHHPYSRQNSSGWLNE